MFRDLHNAIVKTLREQAEWMLAQAEEYESGTSQITSGYGLHVIIRTNDVAADLRHRAGNVQALIAAYERLDA